MPGTPPEPARTRLAQARGDLPDPVAFEAALERSRAALDELAARTAELEAAMPEQLEGALEAAMRAEVLPVARHIAELRGLAAQTIRRLERLQGDLDAERRARVEDLAVLVDVVASGWSGVASRLDRLERLLEGRPGADVYPIMARHERASGA